MRMAIIGTGISGLGAAYLLAPHHDITVYEKNAYIGGHSRTIELIDGKNAIPVDTGFIVFNERNYPLLTALFKHLKIPVTKSDMSFGASINGGWLEYGSKGMLSQKRNIFRPKFWGMIFDILKFNRIASKAEDIPLDLTLDAYTKQLKMGDWFKHYYLQAMGAAIWSCSVDIMMRFPARSFLQFFKNHGLLTINDHPQWYTVTGGSREYVERLCASFRDRICLNSSISKVSRSGGKTFIHEENGAVTEFDHVIFACHADQALKLLDNPDADEKNILGAFDYQENCVVVHRDTSFMPKIRGSWASWIYLSDRKVDHQPVISLSYWMNNLQPLATDDPVIVTLNPGRRPDPATIADEHAFDHPVFTVTALKAQQRIPEIQGRGGIWHTGAYQRYGFHEDGLLSAVTVAGLLGVKPPWH